MYFAPINISRVKLEMYIETRVILHVKALLFFLDFDEKWESMKKIVKSHSIKFKEDSFSPFSFL
jgi:hypothetical protein